MNKSLKDKLFAVWIVCGFFATFSSVASFLLAVAPEIGLVALIFLSALISGIVWEHIVSRVKWWNNEP